MLKEHIMTPYTMSRSGAAESASYILQLQLERDSLITDFHSLDAEKQRC